MIKEKYYQFNTRPNQKFQLSQWFEQALDSAIHRQDIALNAEQLVDGIVADLKDYSNINNIKDVVIGISGGIDSAVTAALFKRAGWTVTGVLMPINQNPMETMRGREVVDSLGIQSREHDLTKLFTDAQDFFSHNIDPVGGGGRAGAIRLGNIRARLRMITLYNIASQLGGCVGSTDNFSELAAGFWTLHGDVGDIAPIQSLTKSWEVPLVAEYLDLPQSVIEANPTDGLGIDRGDESQFGHTYAELDLWLLETMASGPQLTNNQNIAVFDQIQARIRNSTFKRVNPVNFDHPVSGNRRYQLLSRIDETLISNSIKQTHTPEVQNV